MYRAVNPSWASSGLTRLRLSRIASQLWLMGRQADCVGGIVTTGAPPRLWMGGPLRAENVLKMQPAIVERQALHDQRLHIHRGTKRWLQWWHQTNSRLKNNAWIVRSSLELSSRATEALWESLRRWMGQVHMGLHDLEMWERRSDGVQGNVHHRIHDIDGNLPLRLDSMGERVP